MRRTNYYLNTFKEAPKDAQIASHRLMLRAGLVRQCASGIYAWAPLGVRVLQNIQTIVADELDKIGAQGWLMPTLQPSDLWQKTNRFDAYGKELLKMKDRHDRDLLYSPTCEEMITDLFGQNTKSYKQLPQVWYQMQWKFRDEIRPRFGVMRGREFLMKDAYSFHMSQNDLTAYYETILRTYLKIFTRLGLNAVPVKADPGEIGGDLSHEFHILAETGESALYYHKDFESVDYNTLTLEELRNWYAATDEMHDAAEVDADDLKSARGIEVSHIFALGQKYTNALDVKVQGQDGKPAAPFMGCYGIGISRLVGAVIEACHDARGIIWPASIAPYTVYFSCLSMKDETAVEMADNLYKTLQDAGITVLYDDRNEGVGAKLGDADLVGCPFQVNIGKKTLEQGGVEVKNRKTGVSQIMPADQVVQAFGD